MDIYNGYGSLYCIITKDTYDKYIYNIIAYDISSHFETTPKGSYSAYITGSDGLEFIQNEYINYDNLVEFTNYNSIYHIIDNKIKFTIDNIKNLKLMKHNINCLEFSENFKIPCHLISPILV
jgi:hypothetical protein